MVLANCGAVLAAIWTVWPRGKRLKSSDAAKSWRGSCRPSRRYLNHLMIATAGERRPAGVPMHRSKSLKCDETPPPISTALRLGSASESAIAGCW